MDITRRGFLGERSGSYTAMVTPNSSKSSLENSTILGPQHEAGCRAHCHVQGMTRSMQKGTPDGRKRA